MGTINKAKAVKKASRNAFMFLRNTTTQVVKDKKKYNRTSKHKKVYC